MALRNVPLANQRISATQKPINQNFIQYIDNEFAVNHIGFVTTGAGKHNLCQYPQTTFASAIGASELALLNDVSSLSGKQVLKLLLGSQDKTMAYGINDFKQGTTTGGLPVHAAAGWTYIPSGLILKWGLLQFQVNTNPVSVVFPANTGAPNGVPAFTQPPYFVGLQPAINSSSTLNNALNILYDASYTKDGFTMTSANGNLLVSQSFWYFAIGI